MIVNVVLVFRKTEQNGEIMIFDGDDNIIDELEFFSLPELIDAFDEMWSRYDVATFEVKKL